MTNPTQPDPLKSRIIIGIYGLLLLFFIGKMIFYSLYVGHFPDEMEHISYIAYLETEHKLIPDFADMKILVREGSTDTTLNASNNFSGRFQFGDSVNYLGHPPLYYQIMRLAAGVQTDGGRIIIHIVRLHVFSMLLAVMAMLLIFYIGWSRIGPRPVLHLLYGVICVSVPMLAYDSAGINNDTLAMLAIPLFLLGLLRFAESRRNFPTYLLIAAGVFTSLMAKLTAGMIVCAALAIVCLLTVCRERSARFLLSRDFLLTLPVYALAVVYYAAIYRQTGAVQPTLRLLSPAQFYASGFYVPPGQRKSYGFFSYIHYFLYVLSVSWTGIFSHVRYIKTSPPFAPDTIALMSLWVLPPVFLLLRHGRSGTTARLRVLLALYIGTFFTVAAQYFHAYLEFRNISGYLGGNSSRYYLCIIPVLALSMTLPFRETGRDGARGERFTRPKRRFFPRPSAGTTLNLYCILTSLLLVYEDFVCFLLRFSGVL